MELVQWCSKYRDGDGIKGGSGKTVIAYYAIVKFDYTDKEMLEESELLEEAKEYTQKTFKKDVNLKLRVSYNEDLDKYKEEVKKFLNRYVDEYTKKYK